MMSNISFSINIPTDSDGYFNLCCPYCKNDFKIHGAEFNETEIVDIYCPVCGLIAEFNSFYTDKVKSKVRSIAKNYAEDFIYQIFKDLERKNNRNKYVKIKAKKKPTTDVLELYETDNHLVIVKKICCNSHFKVTELDKWLIPYCIYCGGK